MQGLRTFTVHLWALNELLAQPVPETDLVANANRLHAEEELRLEVFSLVMMLIRMDEWNAAMEGARTSAKVKRGRESVYYHLLFLFERYGWVLNTVPDGNWSGGWDWDATNAAIDYLLDSHWHVHPSLGCGDVKTQVKVNETFRRLTTHCCPHCRRPYDKTED